MTFSTIILSFSSLGIVTSILLLYGVYRVSWKNINNDLSQEKIVCLLFLFQDQRVLLIPWIITLAGFVTVDIVHCGYILLTHAVSIIRYSQSRTEDPQEVQPLQPLSCSGLVEASIQGNILLVYSGLFPVFSLLFLCFRVVSRCPVSGMSAMQKLNRSEASTSS